MNKNKFFIMLTGFPGTGKTTFRKSLHQTSNLMFRHLSTDDHIEYVAACENKNYDDVFEREFKTAKKFMNHNLMTALKDGVNIIWDQTNLTLAARFSRVSVIPENYFKILISFDLNEDLHRQLFMTRTDKKMSWSVVERMKKTAELPISNVEPGFDKVIIIRTLDDLQYLNDMPMSIFVATEKDIKFEDAIGKI